MYPTEVLVAGATTTTDCCTTSTADLLLLLRPLVSRRVGLTISPAAHGPNVAVERQAKSAYYYSWLGFIRYYVGRRKSLKNKAVCLLWTGPVCLTYSAADRLELPAVDRPTLPSVGRPSLPAVGRHSVHAVNRHSLPAVGRHKKNVMILCFEHGPAQTCMCLQTLPHLDLRTVNDFPPHQDEKVSCVCVHSQSPRGLDLVACASSAVVKGGTKKKARGDWIWWRVRRARW